MSSQLKILETLASKNKSQKEDIHRLNTLVLKQAATISTLTSLLEDKSGSPSKRARLSSGETSGKSKSQELSSTIMSVTPQGFAKLSAAPSSSSSSTLSFKGHPLSQTKSTTEKAGAFERSRGSDAMFQTQRSLFQDTTMENEDGGPLFKSHSQASASTTLYIIGQDSGFGRLSILPFQTLKDVQAVLSKLNSVLVCSYGFKVVGGCPDEVFAVVSKSSLYGAWSSCVGVFLDEWSAQAMARSMNRSLDEKDTREVKSRFNDAKFLNYSHVKVYVDKFSK